MDSRLPWQEALPRGLAPDFRNCLLQGGTLDFLRKRLAEEKPEELAQQETPQPWARLAVDCSLVCLLRPWYQIE